MNWLLLSVALANSSDCHSLQEPCSEDLAAVVESLEGESFDESEELEVAEPYEGLPPGDLTAEDLEEAWAHFQSEDANFPDLFAALADGQERLLPGEVVQELMERAGADVGLLPLERLVEVYSDGQVMDFRFDFDGESSLTTPTPETTVYYLKDGVLTSAVEKSRNVKVKETVQIEISPDGIEGIRKGDLKIQNLFYVKVGARTEYEPGRVATYEGHPVVVVDSNGEPVMTDGEYETQTYDDWMILVPPVGSEVWIGIPGF